MNKRPTLLLTGLLALLAACGQQTASTPQTGTRVQTPAQGPSKAQAVSSTLSATSVDPNCTTSSATVTCTYTYTGTAQTWTVPAEVTEATFDVYGAEGGGPYGGLGGQATATIAVTPEEVFDLYVGGKGGFGGFGEPNPPPYDGGFNGGGRGGRNDSNAGGGGGGASDVRRAGERIIVAGGGGGSGDGYRHAQGGVGGGTAGGDGSQGTANDSGAAGGRGGRGGGAVDGRGTAGGDSDFPGGGGGGGYNGGTGGGGGTRTGTCGSCASNGGGGGGGSGYITPSATNATLIAGNRGGYGLITISYASAPSDTTPPVITANVVGTQGSNGWYTGDVTVSWGVSDPESTVTMTSWGCHEQSVTSDTTTDGTTFTCEATSAGGTSTQSVTVKRDATAPTLDPKVNPNPVLLGGTATASPNASDTLSGLFSSSCLSVTTSSVGPQSVNCTATDLAGNTNTKSASYTVAYPFSGFRQPVDNLPTVNTVKAGSSIPVKFSLSGNRGLNILAAGSPTVKLVPCDSSVVADEIEQTVTAGGSSLSYDAITDTYSYVWKTEKSWAGSCRQLNVVLADGTPHLAAFRFR